MLLNAKSFPFSFFLGGHEVVDSLEVGATKNGGATSFKNAIVSNIDSGDFIQVNEDSNSLSILVPSTVNVDSAIDNHEYVQKVVKKLSFYDKNSISYYNTKGSWYSEDLEKVVVEKITVVNVDFARKINGFDIMYFVGLARMLKKEMSQEGVSVYINQALAII